MNRTRISQLLATFSLLSSISIAPAQQIDGSKDTDNNERLKTIADTIESRINASTSVRIVFRLEQSGLAGQEDWNSVSHCLYSRSGEKLRCEQLSTIQSAPYQTDRVVGVFANGQGIIDMGRVNQFGDYYRSFTEKREEVEGLVNPFVYSGEKTAIASLRKATEDNTAEVRIETDGGMTKITVQAENKYKTEISINNGDSTLTAINLFDPNGLLVTRWRDIGYHKCGDTLFPISSIKEVFNDRNEVVSSDRYSLINDDIASAPLKSDFYVEIPAEMPLYDLDNMQWDQNGEMREAVVNRIQGGK